MRTPSRLIPALCGTFAAVALFAALPAAAQMDRATGLPGAVSVPQANEAAGAEATGAGLGMQTQNGGSQPEAISAPVQPSGVLVGSIAEGPDRALPVEPTVTDPAATGLGR